MKKLITLLSLLTTTSIVSIAASCSSSNVTQEDSNPTNESSNEQATQKEQEKQESQKEEKEKIKANKKKEDSIEKEVEIEQIHQNIEFTILNQKELQDQIAKYRQTNESTLKPYLTLYKQNNSSYFSLFKNPLALIQMNNSSNEIKGFGSDGSARKGIKLFFANYTHPTNSKGNVIVKENTIVIQYLLNDQVYLYEIKLPDDFNKITTKE
ncbi:Vmc-like lipoprotein signal peptide domain-containing protein [Mycoplasmopsis cricetuli]|uniref:Vmc-like lipoprotein signal peptide domain-containing protein n=1 Tax=Mycoplasmopsis cricetuli TaxID=171283 RepID=UPI00047217EA|nr:hypothetical protein [Mycoplasmopsis cricetuli]